MQTIIYLIRHGEVDNPDGILYGRLPNFGLSKRGKKEIEKTAEFLRSKHVDIIYSSSLNRAKQSAAIIQKKLALSTIHISDEIIEVGTSYQGKKFSDLDELQSEVYLKPLDPSDETIEQLAKRMKDFLNRVIKTHIGKKIVIISHGDPIMALKAIIGNRSLEFYSFKTDNYIQHGEVYQITADENGNLSLTSVFKP